MKTLIAALTIALTSSFASAEWRTSIPEAQPGTLAHEHIRSLLERAANSGEYSYQPATFYTVKAESAFAPSASGKIQMYLQVNGKYFLIPMELTHVDNWSTWARRKGDARGIYLIQRGHRLAGGVLWRVVATMRLTQLDGTPFPVIAYSEVTSKEPCPQCVK